MPNLFRSWLSYDSWLHDSKVFPYYHVVCKDSNRQAAKKPTAIAMTPYRKPSAGEGADSSVDAGARRRRGRVTSGTNFSVLEPLISTEACAYEIETTFMLIGLAEIALQHHEENNHKFPAYCRAYIGTDQVRDIEADIKQDLDDRRKHKMQSVQQVASRAPSSSSENEGGLSSSADAQ